MNEMDRREIRRGEIWYVKQNSNVIGCEEQAGRPAIIVSNNKNNTYSPVLQVVFLTTQEKKPLPTHVLVDDITSGLRESSTALCEQITRVGKERIGDYIGRVADATMEEIDKALMIQLDLDRYITETPERPSIIPAQEEIQPLNEDIAMELEKAKQEAEFYKKQYEAILDKLLAKI